MDATVRILPFGMGDFDPDVEYEVSLRSFDIDGPLPEPVCKRPGTGPVRTWFMRGMIEASFTFQGECEHEFVVEGFWRGGEHRKRRFACMP
jgi:hypothetical protein